MAQCDMNLLCYFKLLNLILFVVEVHRSINNILYQQHSLGGTYIFKNRESLILF